jgi:hypothetical protein
MDSDMLICVARSALAESIFRAYFSTNIQDVAVKFACCWLSLAEYKSKNASRD